MGTSQSSPAVSNKSHASNNKFKDVRGTSARGRKRSTFAKTHLESAPFGLADSCVSHHSDDVHHPDYDFSERLSEHIEHELEYDDNLFEIESNDAVHTDDYSSIADGDVSISDFDSEVSDDEEEDEEWEERMRVLADARKLKEVAGFFLHPEQPVERTFSSRCYFDRSSAPPRLSKEEADELAAILDDAKALKKCASDYMHPEFSVTSSNPVAFGRNYFNRASALEQDCYDDAEERMMILKDAASLKKLAIDYMHPEVPVVTVDSTVCGRNYFSGPSAHIYEDADVDERELILADMKALKQAAIEYMHPELPVVTDPIAKGRNFFTRPSGPEQVSAEDDAEFSLIMDDVQAMKKLAVGYMHPEIPVVTCDSTSFGRNYFGRASAAEQDEYDLAEQRARVMADSKMLKKAAIDYMHPELPVATSDPFACGRNYFTRSSAPEYYDEDEAEERAQILNEMKSMKQLSVDFMHPEVKVTCTDPSARGRNFFSRFSATEHEQESLSDCKYRAQVMADMKIFKKVAVDYLHPELPVTSDPASSGRNYFRRPSAPEQESLTDAETRSQVMEDLKLFRKFATDYLHPERPVVRADPTAFARNFFMRPSVHEAKSSRHEMERAEILKDMKAMKKFAVDYLHPELPVSCDPTGCARNYFSRPSAQEYDTDAEERELVLEETKALMKLAVDYRHPEVPVVSQDPTASGRNFFSRPSGPEYDEEQAEETELIKQDTRAMKKFATDYLHPELPVVNSDFTSYGRNYFTRPSAPECHSEDEEERELVLQDMKALKKLAIVYRHPELPVLSGDPRSFGRNYFSRPSASVQTSEEDLVEQKKIMEDIVALKRLAADYIHPELPVVNKDPAAFGRGYFTRLTAPDNENEDRELAEERERVLQDMKVMKKLVTDFRHPELPVKSEDPTACGRNYFDRASSIVHYYMIHTFPAHDDDREHHHEHLDHFHMDDEVAMYGDMHHDFDAHFHHAEAFTKNENEEEGNLSRSPSSVMLFCEENY